MNECYIIKLDFRSNTASTGWFAAESILVEHHQGSYYRHLHDNHSQPPLLCCLEESNEVSNEYHRIPSDLVFFNQQKVDLPMASFW